LYLLKLGHEANIVLIVVIIIGVTCSDIVAIVKKSYVQIEYFNLKVSELN